MKNINNIVKLIFGILILTTSCTEDFEDINANPNSPEIVQTSQLLSSAQRAAKSTLFSRERTGIIYAQHWSETDYTNISTFSNSEDSFYSFYSGCLANLQEIIRFNTDENTIPTVLESGATENQLAVARILKAWVFMNITDVWGDIPYFEAVQGNENASPKYDEQSLIYEDLVKELKEASIQINENELGVKGDIIYDGDMVKWRKFANSLLLRIGMRLSKVDSNTGQQIVVDALSAGVFESKDDNALYRHLEDESNANDHYLNFVRRDDYAISNTLISYMQAGGTSSVDDPRIAKYANPAAEPDPAVLEVFYIGDYGGMPYGIDGADALSLPNGLSSQPGEMVRSKTSPTIFMTYAETLFIKAEARERNWITSGNVVDMLEEAVLASMDFWEVSNVDAQNYFDGLTIDPDLLETISTQNWLALYMQGITAWSNWRRTGYPILSPGPFTQETNQIPRRRSYNTDEYTLNGDNVRAAVTRQGPDNFDTRIWWDKN